MQPIQQEKRQPCEVWTRVMGYHRPVSSFNIGKTSEHKERKHFTEQGRGMGFDLKGMFTMLMAVAAVVGWAVIESLLWILSHVSIGVAW